MKPDVYSWDRLIVEKEKEIEQVKYLRSKFENIEPGFYCKLVVSSLSPRLIIYSLSDLHYARDFLRDVFGSWSDRFEHVFASGDTAFAVWEGQKEDIAIWLQAPITDFPDMGEVTGHNCSFVKTGNTADWSYICKTEN